VESLLESGHHVRILDNLSTGKRDNVSTDCEVVVGDIVDRQLVGENIRDMDGCFHLAAISSVQESVHHWIRTHQVNQTGSINVFDAAKERRVPVVYASSAAVYGDNADIPLKESSAVRPITAYGADKYGTELHARAASLLHKVPTTGLRFFNVYGPRQDPRSPYSGVISIFADRVINDEKITVFSDGEQVRDFVYVKDVVRFLRAAMVKATTTPAVFNVCTGRPITINQLAKTVISVAGVQVDIEHRSSRDGDIRVSIGDPGYAGRELNVTATHPLIRGLQDYIATLVTNMAETKLEAPRRVLNNY
jgi:UDP-glucose 4-epimerase